MTEQELEDEIKQDLTRAELIQYVDRDRCQFIDFPAFADIVLKDASKIEDIEQVVAATSSRLLNKGIQLETVVRGAWEVQTVEYDGASRGPSGGVMNGGSYVVTLRCGARQAKATVDMSRSVLDTLATISRVPAAVPERIAFLEGIVRSLTSEWLSRTAEGCWDPIKEPRRAVPAIPLRVALAQTA